MTIVQGVPKKVWDRFFKVWALATLGIFWPFWALLDGDTSIFDGHVLHKSQRNVVFGRSSEMEVKICKNKEGWAIEPVCSNTYLLMKFWMKLFSRAFLSNADFESRRNQVLVESWKLILGRCTLLPRISCIALQSTQTQDQIPTIFSWWSLKKQQQWNHSLTEPPKHVTDLENESFLCPTIGHLL